MERVFSVNVNEVVAVLNDWVDDRITKEMVKEILDEEQDLFAEIAQWGIHDTVSREMFADKLANKFTGMDWPIGADSKKIKDEFTKKWQEAMFKATGCNYDENYCGECNKGTYCCTIEHEED